VSKQDLNSQIHALERALERERNARKNAEELLRQKAMEVFEVNERLNISAERLRLSLWASNEAIWEWNASDNMFRLYTAITEDEVKIYERGTLEHAINELHPDYQQGFRDAWAAHERQEEEYFNYRALRMSGSRGAYRWVSMRGRIVKRDSNGKAKHFIGLFRDIHNSVLRKQTYHTIVDAFLSSSRPGFIINLQSMHIECNRLCLKIIGVDKTSPKQEDLNSILPIETVMNAIDHNEIKFPASIKLPDGQSERVGLYLSEIPDMSQADPHVVAFFTQNPIPSQK
jgi:PAS domain-containing protein